MLEKSILDSFRLTVAEKRLGVYGLHLYQEGNGELVHRWRSDDEVCLYSGSKTFTSVACGMCRDEGRLALTDKLVDFFPEFRHDAVPGTEACTLRDLLHMACGKTDADIWRRADEDWLRLFLRREQEIAPGSRFNYVNMCTYTVARVVEKVSGQNVREYLMPRLFGPFGIPNPQWHADPDGHPLGASGLFLRTEEFSKLGRLLLQDGVWEDRQLVSKEYVTAMHEDTIDNSFWGDPESQCGYGYQMWRCTWPGSYRADGMYGQFSIVLPDKRAVVTVTSHEERCPNDIIRAVFADVAPRL